MGKKKATGEKRRSKYQNDVEGYGLDLSMQSVTEVSVPDLTLLNNVTKYDFSLNSLTSLPESFCRLTQLVRLDLSSNQLFELPVDFGDLVSLRHLNLFKNRLRGLPLSFGELESLQWLDVQANEFDPKQIPRDIVGSAESDTHDKEKKACAKRIVEHMAKKKTSFERTRARKQKDKEKTQEAVMAKQKAEADRRKAEEKAAKAAAKAERRAEFEAAQKRGGGNPRETVVAGAHTENAMGIDQHNERQSHLCGTFMLIAMVLGFIAILAAACNVFLMPGGGKMGKMQDMESLTNTILDWLNTLSGTATII